MICYRAVYVGLRFKFNRFDNNTVFNLFTPFMINKVA